MAIQLFGYILSIAGLCGLIVATFTNEWKVVGYHNDNTMFVDLSEGLWMKCSADSSSRVTCVSYTSILHQPVEIQVGRAMMIISIALSGIAAMIAISGLSCTRCLDGNDQSKNRVAFTGGILFILSGLCALAITSWFMYGIVEEFYETKSSNEFKYVLGASLIGGFAAALFCVFGGALLCVCSATHLRSSADVPMRPISKRPAKDYV